MFNRIVTSTNEDETYLGFWKIQLLSHQIFFPNQKLTIAFYTDRNQDDELIMEMQKQGIDVFIYKKIPNVIEQNISKILRYICASQFEEEVCLTVDIDTIPLQSEYINKITNHRQKNKLLAVGKEVFNNTEHEGKFPAHHMCAEGKIFKKLYNSNNLDLYGIVQELSGLKIFDDKEDISKPNFSDESLNRALIHKNQIDVQHIKREIDIHSDWIDRSWWNLDESKLNRGEYIESNLLRPYSKYEKQLSPIENYLISLLKQTKNNVN